MKKSYKIIIFILIILPCIALFFGCGGDKGTDSENGLGTIIIDSSPNELNAPWLLCGPFSYNTTGTGEDTLTALLPGDYTLSWGMISGWITPLDSTQTLMENETVMFVGNYEEEPGPETGTVTDIDGNIYQTIKIGDQWWMAENLKVTHYRNGESMPNVTDSIEWANLSTGAYCNYDNDEGHVATYGRLYNWYAVDDSKNIAPEGWHVPTDEEWKTLEIYLGMDQLAADSGGLRGTDEGGKLKETETLHWKNPNVGATNESGFTALPGGYRWSKTGGISDMGLFKTISSSAYFWSNSKDNWIYAWARNLYHRRATIYRERRSKENGYSIRCVKD